MFRSVLRFAPPIPIAAPSSLKLSLIRARDAGFQSAPLTRPTRAYSTSPVRQTFIVIQQMKANPAPKISFQTVKSSASSTPWFLVHLVLPPLFSSQVDPSHFWHNFIPVLSFTSELLFGSQTHLCESVLLNSSLQRTGLSDCITPSNGA